MATRTPNRSFLLDIQPIKNDNNLDNSLIMKPHIKMKYNLFIPIIVNIFIDGLCIGIITVGTNFQAGLLISIGTAIEVIFLGIALGIDLKILGNCRVQLIGLICGLVIMIGGIAGAFLSNELTEKA